MPTQPISERSFHGGYNYEIFFLLLQIFSFKFCGFSCWRHFSSSTYLNLPVRRLKIVQTYVMSRGASKEPLPSSGLHTFLAYHHIGDRWSLFLLKAFAHSKICTLGSGEFLQSLDNFCRHFFYKRSANLTYELICNVGKLPRMCSRLIIFHRSRHY